MVAQILDGRVVANQQLDKIKQRITEKIAKGVSYTWSSGGFCWEMILIQSYT